MDSLPNEILLQILVKLGLDVSALLNVRLVSQKFNDVASIYMSKYLPPIQVSSDKLRGFASCFAVARIWPVSNLKIFYEPFSTKSTSVVVKFLKSFGSRITSLALEPTQEREERNYYWHSVEEREKSIVQKDRLINSLSKCTNVKELWLNSLPCYLTANCSNSEFTNYLPLPALPQLRKLTLWYNSHDNLETTLNSNTLLSHLTLKWSVHEYDFNLLLQFWNSIVFLAQRNIRQVVELDLCITAHFGPTDEDMDHVYDEPDEDVQGREEQPQEEGLELNVFLERLTSLQNGPVLVRLHLKLEFFYCCDDNDISCIHSLLKHVKGTLLSLHLTYWSSRFHSKHTKHCGSHSFRVPTMPRLEFLCLEKGECDDYNDNFLNVSLEPFPSLKEMIIAMNAEAGDIYNWSNIEPSFRYKTFEYVMKLVLVNFGYELLNGSYPNTPAKRLDEIFPNLTDLTIIRETRGYTKPLWEGQDALLLHIFDNYKALKSPRIRIQGNQRDQHSSLFKNALNGLEIQKITPEMAQNYTLNGSMKRKVDSMRTTSILSLPRLEVLELRVPCIDSLTVNLTLSQLRPLKELTLMDQMVSSDFEAVKSRHARYKSVPPLEFSTIKNILTSLG